MSNLNTTNILQKHHTLILYFHTALLNIKTPLITSSVPIMQEHKIKLGAQKTTYISTQGTFQNINLTYLPDGSTKTISQYKETSDIVPKKPIS
jgi:hypothetical protein